MNVGYNVFILVNNSLKYSKIMGGYHDPICDLSLFVHVPFAFLHSRDVVSGTTFVPDMLAVLGVMLVYSSLDPSPLSQVP